MTDKKPKILFVSPYIPYPKADVEYDSVDFFYYRNTLGQKIFRLRQMQSWYPLHFLAQNIPVHSVVLENPSWKVFTTEACNGDYDTAAFTFTVASILNVLDMVRWLRRAKPQIEIVLGGYGTIVFSEHYGPEQELAGLADYICRGEGLSFMRAYLEQRWGIQTQESMRQDFIPTKTGLFRSRIPLYRQICFLAALGCTYRCVFCATSEQYGGKKIHITTPRQLYELIAHNARRHPNITSAIVYDEDFLADRRRVVEFMEYMEKDRDLARRPLLLTVFSSVHSIMKYSVQELIRCGIGLIFVGIESFNREILDSETPIKRSGGEPAELFARLHRSGISTLGSMIAGWDSHTPENIETDLDLFVGLNPTIYQVLPLQAVPGTALWKKMKDHGRCIENFSYDKLVVNRPAFHYKNFTHAQIMVYIRETHKKLTAKGGPSVFKFFENFVTGYKNLHSDSDPFLVQRAEGYGKLMVQVYPLAFISGLIFYGREFRVRWRKTMREFWSLKPAYAAAGAFLGFILLPIISIHCLFGEIRHRVTRHGDQPETIRRVYSN